MIKQRDQRICDLTAKLSALQEETARERARHAAEVHLLVQKNARLFRRASECARSSALNEHAARELRVKLVRLQRNLVEADQLIAMLKERHEEEILRDLSVAQPAESVAPTPAAASEAETPSVVAEAPSPDFSEPARPKRTFRRRQSSAGFTMRRPLSPLPEHSEEERETPTSVLAAKRALQQRIIPESTPSGGSDVPTAEQSPLPRFSPPQMTLPRAVRTEPCRTSPPTESPSTPSVRPPLRTLVAPFVPNPGGSTASMDSSAGPSRTMRPRRASASGTFIEPSLKSKLRKGDPYTFGNEHSGRSAKGSPRSPETDVSSIASELKAAASALLHDDREPQRRAPLSGAGSISRASGGNRFLVRESPPAAAPVALAQPDQQSSSPGTALASPSPASKALSRLAMRKQPAGGAAASSSTPNRTPRGLREINQNAWSQVRLGPAQHTGRIDGYRYAVHF
jgi:hypothetical protein